MKLAVKLLYADSNTVGSVSEVRPHTLPVYKEVLPPTTWQTVKPKYRNVSDRVREAEMKQIIGNRFQPQIDMRC
jgi:hypothetical protein